MQLSELLGSETYLANGEAGTEILGITSDSRAVKPGFLFAALSGSRTDGARFIRDAAALGAVAVLAGEAVVGVMSYAFETLGLHRVEIAIVPRNRASIRVVEKLGLREEGIALRLIEINGVWEDHLRFAITVEEWHQRVPDFRSAYLDEGV